MAGLLILESRPSMASLSRAPDFSKAVSKYLPFYLP